MEDLPHFPKIIAFLEDRSSIWVSILSLSDKYCEQEEVEIFYEHYQIPPPEPVRPKKAVIDNAHEIFPLLLVDGICRIKTQWKPQLNSYHRKMLE